MLYIQGRQKYSDWRLKQEQDQSYPAGSKSAWQKKEQFEKLEQKYCLSSIGDVAEGPSASMLTTVVTRRTRKLRQNRPKRPNGPFHPLELAMQCAVLRVMFRLMNKVFMLALTVWSPSKCFSYTINRAWKGENSKIFPKDNFTSENRFLVQMAWFRN